MLKGISISKTIFYVENSVILLYESIFSINNELSLETFIQASGWNNSLFLKEIIIRDFSPTKNFINCSFCKIFIWKFTFQSNKIKVSDKLIIFDFDYCVVFLIENEFKNFSNLAGKLFEIKSSDIIITNLKITKSDINAVKLHFLKSNINFLKSNIENSNGIYLHFENMMKSIFFSCNFFNNMLIQIKYLISMINCGITLFYQCTFEKNQIISDNSTVIF